MQNENRIIKILTISEDIFLSLSRGKRLESPLRYIYNHFAARSVIHSEEPASVLRSLSSRECRSECNDFP